MAYRNIFVGNEADLRLRSNQLIVNNGEEFSFPIEDIRSILIDNNFSVLSARLISKLAEEGVCLIICDEKHMPSACLLPISSFCRQSRRITLQFEQSKPKMKNIWQSLVIAKINNQAQCLESNGKEADRLYEIAKTVNSGDSSNREGYAARLYFKLLFGEEFKRETENELNAALNYGYAVFRSYISKTIAAYGFEPSIGVHHKNQLNGFNLSDDLIEPFRPIIDNYVFKNREKLRVGFGSAQKAELLLLLNSSVSVNGKKHSVANAVDIAVQSLINSFENEKAAMILPSLL